jgi:hypothetical protein
MHNVSLPSLHEYGSPPESISDNADKFPETIVDVLIPVPPYELQEFLIESFIIPEGRITNLVNTLTEMKPGPALLFYAEQKAAIENDISQTELVDFHTVPLQENRTLATLHENAVSNGAGSEQFLRAYENARKTFEDLSRNLEMIDRVYGREQTDNRNDLESSYKILCQSLRNYVVRMGDLHAAHLPMTQRENLKQYVESLQVEMNASEDEEEFSQLQKRKKTLDTIEEIFRRSEFGL